MPCERKPEHRVSVMPIQGSEEMKVFHASLTTPLRALLHEKVVPLDSAFGKEPRAALTGLVSEVVSGFAAGLGKCK
jgi:hypothetical protein